MKTFFKKILSFILIIVALSFSSSIKAEDNTTASELSFAKDYIAVQYPATHYNYQSFKEEVGQDKVDAGSENKMILTDVFFFKALPFFLLIIIYYVIIKRKANTRTSSF